jgi:hypothetical protein
VRFLEGKAAETPPTYSILKHNSMALAIKSPPVLTGKAALEFYERAAEAKCSKSKEYVQASMRKSKAILAQYYKQLHHD